jgi:hypothetical protein
MNPVGIFILTALIFEFALHRLAEALNLRSASGEVPDPFRERYDSQRYARAQDYLKARTRFAWVSSAVFLAATLAFWLGGGFGFLDDGVRSLGHGSILSGLIYVGALAIGRSLLGVPYWSVDIPLRGEGLKPWRCEAKLKIERASPLGEDRPEEGPYPSADCGLSPAAAAGAAGA